MPTLQVLEAGSMNSRITTDPTDGAPAKDSPDQTRRSFAHTEERSFAHTEDMGLHKGLKKRQVQMIAIGGAIGTGLFMGAGGRLAAAGPSLAIVYALCGFFVFLILRA